MIGILLLAQLAADTSKVSKPTHELGICIVHPKAPNGDSGDGLLFSYAVPLSLPESESVTTEIKWVDKNRLLGNLTKITDVTRLDGDGLMFLLSSPATKSSASFGWPNNEIKESKDGKLFRKILIFSEFTTQESMRGYEGNCFVQSSTNVDRDLQMIEHDWPAVVKN